MYAYDGRSTSNLSHERETDYQRQRADVAGAFESIDLGADKLPINPIA
jgi:hypothetical protein